MATVGRVEAPTRPRFGALSIRDFRQLWLSSIAVGSVQSMEILLLGWYVLEKTNSPLLVGLVGSARWYGMFLAPLGGVLADRVSRRNLLIGVQGIAFAAALTVFLLALTDHLGTGALFAAILVGGLARAFDNTTRQTLVGDLVGPERLTSGVALMQAATNGSSIIAPLVAGVVYKQLGGIAAGYALISVLLASGLLATLPIRPTAIVINHDRRGPVASLVEGFGYVRRHQAVAALLLIAAIANLAMFPLTFAMMPSFAKDVLHVDSVGLGVLLAAVGVGSLTGSLALSSRGSLRRRGRLVVIGMLGWSAAIALFAVTQWFPLALVFLVLVGINNALCLPLVAALLLVNTPEPMRGRVMGVRMFAILTLPFGGMFAGWLIEATTAPITALAFAAAGALLTLATVALMPKLARLP